MADSSCNLCTIFSAYQDHAESVLGNLVSAVHGPFLAIMIALIAFWVVWIGIQVLIGTLDLAGALKQVFFMILGFGVYQALEGGALIQKMFETSVDVMGGLSSALMSKGGSTSTGLSGLLQDIENGISSVIDAGVVIMKSGEFYNGSILITAIYGIALIVPYIFLLILFLAHTCVSLFRLTLIFGMSPFLVGMSAFPFGRNLVGAGVRTIIGSIATMLCVTTVFAIVNASVTVLKIGAEDDMNVENYIDLTSGKFLLALIMGWLGSALISEAVNIAGQISSAVLGSVSAGIMAAGAMRGGAMGASVGRAAAGATGKLGGYLHRKTWEKAPGGIIDSSKS
ncbi:hypothetical protein GFK91_29250 (plasmid) [Roseibium aggregatum]|jgi:hypothetical protein|uniref:type IV secretion system protein n=1 Tax=Roseibium aggregatum TaxID=187304 RepID=UPI001E3BE0AE|nr:type IV secretion system protein [Roseibium aggregatum]MEC9401096.1 type IV secretion system protein [Pseudomonadota bacterium]UES59853.1 hypothetical protein GFK91_29250 [Roseibium aggregatum]